MSNILRHLYGSDTRSLRVLNTTIHTIWVYILLVHLGNVLLVDLPCINGSTYFSLLGVSIGTVILSLGSFIETRYKKKLKYLSLILGSLTQALIGIQFVTAFPPFDLMIVVTTVLSIWFVMGAFYLKQIKE